MCNTIQKCGFCSYRYRFINLFKLLLHITRVQRNRHWTRPCVTKACAHPLTPLQETKDNIRNYGNNGLANSRRMQTSYAIYRALATAAILKGHV